MLQNSYNIYYKQILSYDLITKHLYLNYYELPFLTKIRITFINKQIKLKFILYSLLFLEILTNNRPVLSLKKKQSKINLNIKLGIFLGCTINLRKNSMNNFFSFFISSILPLINMSNILPKKDYKNIQIQYYRLNFKDLNIFKEIEIYYEYFNSLSTMSIMFNFNKPIFYSQVITLLYLPVLKN